MDTSIKNYIFLLTTHLVFGFIGYSYRHVLISLLYHVEVGIFQENELSSNLTRIFPYEEQLPTTRPDVRSPVYLIQLTRLEAFIFNLLTDFEREAKHELHPLLLEKIQL